LHHGLSDQAYSPFAARLKACQAATRQANAASGLRALYAPSLSGTPEQVRAQARMAREEGVQVALLAPMLMGLPAFEEAVRYSGERKSFGKALREHQAIQFMLADMATEIDAARLLVLRAA
jgi:alkylation response protein AidB-like acyl-CoA dehydrogenase